MPIFAARSLSGNKNILFDKNPDACPICHHSISSIQFDAYWKEGDSSHPARAEVLFCCPNQECQRLFIARYLAINNDTDQKNFTLHTCLPAEITKRTFSENIVGISPKFSDIYNQAHAAEQSALDEICGPGYRKALEFLIKDYAILKDKSNKELIEKAMLGSCIQQYVGELKIKEVAKRAAWLGNDEVHYLKIWETKDLQDLKKLIDMVINLIDAEQEYDQLMKDMAPKTSTPEMQIPATS